MGSYYALGVIKEFAAQSRNPLSDREWKQILNERIDTNLFKTSIERNTFTGLLLPDIFEKNISQFYDTLKEITGPQRSRNIDFYEEEFGVDRDNYQEFTEALTILDPKGNPVKVKTKCNLLFIEGKVMVETFDTEPHLLNWLFRNSKMENPLSGCMVSSIV